MGHGRLILLEFVNRGKYPLAIEMSTSVKTTYVNHPWLGNDTTEGNLVVPTSSLSERISVLKRENFPPESGSHSDISRVLEFHPGCTSRSDTPEIFVASAAQRDKLSTPGSPID
jgi:hypothetical protein